LTKVQKIKKLNIACIEIDLSKQLLDEVSLTSLFNSNSPLKYWISDPRLDKEYKIELEKEKNRIANEINVKNKENEYKFNLYHNDKIIRLIEIQEQEVNFNCPKKEVALNKLRNTHSYTNPILKRIIDGEYWDGETNVSLYNGNWIFLGKDKKKVFVEPPLYKQEKLNEEEIKFYQRQYVELKEIQRIFNDSNFEECNECKYSVDYIEFNNKGYEVCQYPNEYIKVKDQYNLLF